MKKIYIILVIILCCNKPDRPKVDIFPPEVGTKPEPITAKLTVIASDGLRIREERSSKSKTLAIIPHLTEVELTLPGNIDLDDSGPEQWLPIEYKKLRGFVSSLFVHKVFRIKRSPEGNFRLLQAIPANRAGDEYQLESDIIILDGTGKQRFRAKFKGVDELIWVNGPEAIVKTRFADAMDNADAVYKIDTQNFTSVNTFAFSGTGFYGGPVECKESGDCVCGYGLFSAGKNTYYFAHSQNLKIYKVINNDISLKDVPGKICKKVDISGFSLAFELPKATDFKILRDYYDGIKFQANQKFYYIHYLTGSIGELP